MPRGIGYPKKTGAKKTTGKFVPIPAPIPVKKLSKPKAKTLSKKVRDEGMKGIAKTRFGANRRKIKELLK